MKTKTHLIARDNDLYLTKFELCRHFEKIIVFKVKCSKGVAEFRLN